MKRTGNLAMACRVGWKSGAALLLSAAIGAASATQLQLSLQGSASGTVGGVSFTDATFTIDLLADTANYVPNVISGLYAYEPLDRAVVSIQGFTPAEVLAPTTFGGWYDYSGHHGYTFGRLFLPLPGEADLLDFETSEPLTYDQIIKPLGPMTSVGGAFGTQGFVNIPSSLGLLTLNSTSPIVFQIATVPEPASYALMLAGLGALAMAWRRRPVPSSAGDQDR